MPILNPQNIELNQLKRDRKQRLVNFYYLLTVAAFIITLCSKSSPLFPFNDWVDSNIYMTLGKSMWNGKVLYQDLYDQKGPFIFAVHAVASLISRTSFLGVWLMEITYAFFFLLYSIKSISLFCGKHSYFWAAILAILTFTSTSFSHGDSAEELALPFLAYATWVGLNSLCYNKYPSTKQLIAIGITSGCVFWTKYSLVGLYIGWFIALVIFLPKEDKLKQVMSMILKIVIGVLISTLPWILYFGINHAIKDLFIAYFYNNLFYYRYERTVNLLLHYVIHFGLNIQNLVVNNIAAFIFLIIGLIYFIKKKNKKIVTYITLCFLFCFFLTYSARRHPYSPLVFSAFSVYGLVCIDSLVFTKLQSLINKIKGWKIIRIILFAIIALLLSPNTYMLKYNKEDLPQYKFKEIIDKTPNAKVLMYQTLDTGVYTVSNLVPQTKYYFKPNLDMKEIDNSQLEYIIDGECDYIVVRIENYEENKDKYTQIFNTLTVSGYGVIAQETYLTEGETVTDQLYAKLKP